MAPGPAWNRAGPRLQLPVSLALACAQGLGLAFLEAIKRQRLGSRDWVGGDSSLDGCEEGGRKDTKPALLREMGTSVVF